MGAKDPHVRYQSAHAVVVALQSWLPVAQWQALGLSTAPSDAAHTAPTALRADDAREPETAAPAKKGGGFGFLRRLFGR